MCALNKFKCTWKAGQRQTPFYGREKWKLGEIENKLLKYGNRTRTQVSSTSEEDTVLYRRSFSYLRLQEDTSRSLPIIIYFIQNNLEDPDL